MRWIQLLTLWVLCIYPASVNAQMTAQEFFQDSDMLAAQVSPSGAKIVTIRHTEKGSRVTLFDSHSLSESILLDVNEFTPKDASIRALRWIDDKHVAAQFLEVKEGIKDLLDTRQKRYLLVIKISDDSNKPHTILSVRTDGWMINPLPSENGMLLFAKAGIYSKVYKIDVTKLLPHKKKINKLTKIDGGQFKKANEVVSLEGYVTRWFSDKQGIPVAALYFNKERNLSLATIKEVEGEQKVTEIKTWEKDDIKEQDKDAPRILPIAMGPQPSVFYCLDFAEEQERSVYKVNYDSGEEELVYESDSYKIVDLILNETTNQLTGVKVLEEGEIRNIYLQIEDEESVLGKNLTNSELNIQISQNLSEDVALFYSESHTQSGQYKLMTSGSEPKRVLGSQFPHLDGKLNSQLIEDKVTVTGLDIPYLLSLPITVKNPLGLVVMPHGGPTGVFDDRYFDLPTQFLVANGYAVLRVNFRGSGGISPELREAGKKQWGGMMIEDLYQAAQSVLQRDDINKQQVCVFGMSYGGYAATKLVLEYPETFNCAVTVAGVSDINLFVTKTDISSQQKRWLIENVGDTEIEYDRLKSESPLYAIHTLKRPYLIIHGAKDERVDVEHAYRLKRALDAAELPYQWHIIPEGEHSFGPTNQSVELFDKILGFINSNIKRK